MGELERRGQMGRENGRAGKERTETEAVTSFKLISHHLPGRTDESSTNLRLKNAPALIRTGYLYNTVMC
jgi:hypothetical protein